MRRLAGVALAVGMVAGIAACVPVEGGGPVTRPGGGVNQCGALDLQYLIGAPYFDIYEMSFNKPYRIVRPNDAVTMDYNPDRINFETDRMGRVVRITCG